MLEVYLLDIALLATVAFAVLKGGRPERLGALWLLFNVAIHTLLQLYGPRTTAFDLMADGIYATGLLPLAFFFVSWWIGIQTLIACAGFGIEAFYLLLDRPVDYTFTGISNLLFGAGILNLFGATLGSLWHRRRSAARTAAAFPA